MRPILGAVLRIIGVVCVLVGLYAFYYTFLGPNQIVFQRTRGETPKTITEIIKETLFGR